MWIKSHRTKVQLGTAERGADMKKRQTFSPCFEKIRWLHRIPNIPDQSTEDRQNTMKKEEEQNKAECTETYLKVVISKQILSIIVGHIFIILEDRNKWNLKCREKNWPVFQAVKWWQNRKLGFLIFQKHMINFTKLSL